MAASCCTTWRSIPRRAPRSCPTSCSGCAGPRSLAVSGRIADGTVLAEPATPEYVRAALRSDRRHAAAPDRRLQRRGRRRSGCRCPGDRETRAGVDRRAGLGAAHRAAPLRRGLRGAPRAVGHARGVRRADARRVGGAARARGHAVTVAARVQELGAAGVTSSVMIPVGAGSPGRRAEPRPGALRCVQSAAA